ncbi:DUF6020 family protein [Bifidobacterium leontopitheci]|nr:DUF6020 family protein [Bifidobacterium leontopitheci]
MIQTRFRPPRAAQCVLCAVVSLVVTMAGNAATRATLAPFDVWLAVRTVLLAVTLTILYTIGESLVGMTRRESERHETERHETEPHPVAGDFFNDRIRGAAARHQRLLCALRRLRTPLRHLGERLNRADARWSALPTTVRWLLVAAVLLLCWSPIIIMMFPGTVWYDTGEQIAQYYGLSVRGSLPGTLSAHHPVLDTLVFGMFARFGTWMGDMRAGLAVLTLLQVTASALGLAAVVVYARHVGAGRVTAAAMFLLFALYPALPILMMSLVKETLHMVVLVPWMLLYTEVVRTRLSALRSPRFCAAFVVMSALCALTTMTGLYITILSLALLPLARRRDTAGRRSLCVRALVVTVLTAAVAFAVFPAAVSTLLQVRKDDANQIMVVPMQMTARYVTDRPDDITTSERQAIDAVNHVPVEDMAEAYNPYLADPIIQYSLRDPHGVGPYLAAWLSMGLRHPDAYFNGYAALESGWFSLTRTPIDGTGHPIHLGDLAATADQATANRMKFQIDDSYSPVFRLLPGYREDGLYRAGADALWRAWCSTPVLGIATLTAVWTFLLPMFLVFCRMRTVRSLSPFRRVRPRRRRDTAPAHGRADVTASDRRQSNGPYAMFAVPLVWSLLSLLANAISIPLKPTSTRYMIWTVVMIPFLIALLRADRVRPRLLWPGDPASAAASRPSPTPTAMSTTIVPAQGGIR